MTKSKKWLIAAGVAAIFAVNGAVMAAIDTQKQQENSKRPGFSDKRDFVHKGEMKKNCKADRQALLDLLKIDDQTFKAELKAGKTMVTIAKEHGVAEKELKSFIVNQRIKRIDEGVKAGRLTSEQADRMKSKLDQRVSDMINGKVPMHRGHHGMFANKELLALLKIDAETMRSELKAGKTLVAIAGEHGVSEQQLKDFMVSSMTQRIDKGVENGRLTAEQANKLKSNLDQRVSDMINGKVPMHRGHHGMFANKELLALLKIDAETMKSELKAGKTLVAIAGEHGVSEQQLKEFMVSSMTQRIDNGVECGRITAEKAEQMKAGLEQRVADMINGKGPHFGPKHGQQPQQ